jgi:hypothetical protein
MDILLHPVDAARTIDAVVRAVEAGVLTEQRIDESVARVLAEKRRLGLFDKNRKASGTIDHEKHRKIAADLARKAVRTVRGGRMRPLDPAAGVSCFILDDDGQAMGGAFRDALIARFGEVRSVTLTPDSSEAGTSEHLGPGPGGLVVVALFSKISASKGRSGISPKLRDAAFEVLRQAKEAGRRTAVVSFDSPYILDQFRDADQLIAGYDRMDEIQTAAAHLVAGRTRSS